MKLRANMLSKSNLMTEQREYEVAEVTGGGNERVSVQANDAKKRDCVLVASVLRESHVRAESLRVRRGC